MSRLGEVNRGSPRREGSRLSEIPRVLLLHVSSPRLGEGGLAWARTSRLSETLQPERGAGRDSAMWDGFLGFLGDKPLRVEQRYPPQVQASAESD
ncbi:hypothetical protein DEO72_LG1g1685 [Vigna unguiculata]|uniref:Uncharacterized protein n=1 Tax=Vigna unguiculata TaxID=3917 RepID=A0A4D6KJE2_VIGUN|nr:hypothetical protein DEO72_LG1g1685 [Vigna unguiculata]